MSLYEILAVAALIGAGAFAWYLYKSDTRPGAAQRRPDNAGQSMFRRDKGNH